MRVRGCQRSVVVLIGLAGGLLGTASIASGQEGASWDGAWQRVAEPSAELLAAEAWVRPAHYGVFRADLAVLSRELSHAPLEYTREAVEAPLLISIPMPEGDYAAFEIVESPIMEPELAAKFPEVRTLWVRGWTIRRRRSGLI